MKDLLKTILWIITLQWLFDTCGCGCTTINTIIILLICFLLYIFGAF